MSDSVLTIYAVADLHGYHDRINQIAQNIRNLKPDVLVIAGDITGYRNPVAYLRLIDQLPVPVLIVRGNMDSAQIDNLIGQFSNISSLHLKKTIIGGVSFVGMGGTVPVPFSSRICFREKQMIAETQHLIAEDCVLVVHPPPYGTLDEGIGNLHAGSRGLRGLVWEKQPKLLICGHIHERPGWAFIEKTLVVNCSMGRNGTGAVIALSGDTVPTVRMLDT